MRSLVDLVNEAAARHGPRSALAIRRELRTEIWRYVELPGAIATAAARLAAAGLRPGQRVLTLAPNSPELVISMLAVWQCGGVLVPLDLRSTAELTGRICQQIEPSLAIGSGPIAGLDDRQILSPLELAGRQHTVAHPRLAPRDVGASELAEIVYTSGTTGAPKGVLLTHANILANVASSVEAVPIRPGTRILSILPLSHMLEQTVGLLTALAAGTTVYYATSRRPTALLTALQRYRIQLLVCVPELLRLLLAGIEREAERSGRLRELRALLTVADHLPLPLRPFLFGPIHRKLGGRLRLVQCGGAPLEPELWRSWERLGLRVVEGYGATECAPVVSSTRLDRRLPGSVGWPLPGVELKLAADGEILVRGPNVTSGYWRDPVATSAAFEDGWYRTGDIGDFGSAGELYIRGRKKELIVLPDGRNVFPQDVEDELKRDPAIRECAVVGRPRSAGGVEVHAVLIPAGDPDAALAAARRADARLGPHQRLGGISLWPTEDFPRTSSLKVKRVAVLAALEQSAIAAPAATVEPARLEEPGARLRALIARASGRPLATVLPDADLALDLGLDSLARVELAVLIEEEVGRVLPDDELAGARTVADLQTLLDQAAPSASANPLPTWPRGGPAGLTRALLQELLLFPLLHQVAHPLSVRNAERLRQLPGPLLIVANHASHLDSLTVLRLLPPRLRAHTAVAAAADYFFAREPLASGSALLLGAFPFHRQGPIAASLAHCGDLADAGYSILIFPEGTRSPDGSPRPFKPGIGLLARELGLPVLPIHLRGLYQVLPKGCHWPRPGPVQVTVGEPFRLARELSNVESAIRVESAVRGLSRENAAPSS